MKNHFIAFSLLLGLATELGASDLPKIFFISKLGRPELISDFSVETACQGAIPVEANQVKVFCQLPDEDQKHLSTYPCKNGKVHGLVKFDLCAGVGEEAYKEGLKNGPAKLYWPSGKVRKLGVFAAGLKKGTETEYAEDGTLILKAEYDQDQLHGKFYSFDPYKKVSVSRTYVRGQQQGEAIYESKFPQEALIKASGSGDVKAVANLIQKKVNPNLPGEVSSNETAVHAAAEHNKKEVLEYLLANGGNPNVLDQFSAKTPLMSGLFYPEIVKLLLEKKADPNIKGFEGRTALHLATQYSRYDVIALLLSFKSKTDIKNAAGKTAIEIAEGLTTKDKDKILELLRGGISPEGALSDKQVLDCQKKSENLPQLVSSLKENFVSEIANCPLESLQESDLNDALFVATRIDAEPAMNSLIRLGASVLATEAKGQETALLMAAREGYPSALRLLLEKGAEVNAQDLEGYTPLMRAVSAGSKDMTVMLLLRGAKKDIKNSDGKSAVDIARALKKAELEKILLEP